MEKSKLTIERLRAVLDYDPETGIFVRIRSKGVHQSKAKMLPKDKRIRISIDGRRYLASRLAWAYVYGELLPEDVQIDHRDLDILNNRISNLRPATNAQNQANRALQGNNTTGFKGVSFDKERGKWRACIGGGKRGRQITLGRFSSPEYAHKAYCEAALKQYGEFARFA